MAVEMIALEKVAKIYSGSNIKHFSGSGTPFDNEGYPWVMVEDLRSEQIAVTSRTLSRNEMQSTRIAPAQTVLFSSTGTIGKVGITGAPMVPSNNIFALEFNTDRVFPLYGMFCLAAMRSDFISLAKGAVYDSLRLSDFRKVTIPVPEFSEQMLIAENLLAIQRAVCLQQELIDEVDKAISSKFRVLFEHEVNAVAHSHAGKPLSQLADIFLNGAAKSKQPGGISVRYVSTALLADWEIPFETIPMSEVAWSAASRFGLQPGDIVMNRINQVDRLGRCGIVIALPAEPIVFGQNTLCIRIHSRTMEPLFLFAWLKHPFVKQYIKNNAKNSTSFQSSLSKQVLFDIPVPEVEFSLQQAFAEEFKKHLLYVAQANLIVNKLHDLKQVWNNRILRLCQDAAFNQPSAPTDYLHKQYWVTPTGYTCFYDTYLECIQIPLWDSLTINVSQLPRNVDLQFVGDVRGASDVNYGDLFHIRLCKLDDGTVRRTWFQSAAYQPEEVESLLQQQLEENGLISDQQDFGYIRHSEEIKVRDNEPIPSLLEAEAPSEVTPYTRFARIPVAAQQFIRLLSAFQQAIYEEFLLSMQPLACHMVQKQMALRAGNHHFQGCGIQDVIATVQMLERFGLLERKQGFQLDYFPEELQDKNRDPILDHLGHAILMDTWTWILPEGGNQQ